MTQTIMDMLQNLIDQIDELEDNPNSTKHLDVINSAINELKQYVLSTEFKSQDEEIHFFKEIKPKFYSLLLYHYKVNTIQLSRPVGEWKVIKRYYKQELAEISRFFEYNNDIYKYYRSGSTELDSQLFLRGQTYPKWLIKLRLDTDERFSTAADHIYARIQANEMLKSYLENANSQTKSNENPPLKVEAKIWTGDSLDLVELAYGLYYTGRIDNGKTSISEIVRWLELIFNIKIGRAYRRFTEIKRRKKISQTKFMDELKEAILKKLYDEDEYKPRKSGF